MNESEIIANDAALLTAVLSGEVDQFAFLVRRYRQALLRVAYSRLGRIDLAEEAVQEAFLCAWKSLSSYNSRYSFRTWLWTILLNQCRRQAKRQNRRPGVWAWRDKSSEQRAENPYLETLLSNDPTPQEWLLAKERSQQLSQFLSRLPLPQADALRLRFYGGLKFHEIAEAMGCSLSSAKNRVRWGLKKMSRMMVKGETL